MPPCLPYVLLSTPALVMSSLLSPRCHVQQWLDSPGGIPDNRSLSPPNNSDLSSSGGSPPLGHLHAPPITPGTPAGDDEIIPTAIVIKNIPFNVKRETLLDIIVSTPSRTPTRIGMRF